MKQKKNFMPKRMIHRKKMMERWVMGDKKKFFLMSKKREKKYKKNDDENE